MNQEPDQPKYLFQAAVGRSGSTILRRSIGLHPEVYYNGKENNLIHEVAEVGYRNCTMPSRAFAMEVDQSTYDASFRRLICDLVWPDQTLAQKPIHFAAINPNFNNLDYLSQLFPNSKVLCLVRNGIEVVCSRMKFESFAKFDFESHCKVWMRCQEMLDWGEQNPDRFFLFRHEWTHDSKGIGEKVDELIQWAGMKPFDAVVNNIRSVNDCMPTTEAPKELLEMTDAERQNYFQAKGERWRAWTQDQREAFVQVCGSLMNRLGYSIPFKAETSRVDKAA